MRVLKKYPLNPLKRIFNKQINITGENAIEETFNVKYMKRKYNKSKKITSSNPNYIGLLEVLICDFRLKVCVYFVAELNGNLVIFIVSPFFISPLNILSAISSSIYF